MPPLRRNERISLLSSRELLRGPIFDLYQEAIELPSGRRQELLVVDHPGAVCIVPEMADGNWLLVRQYRHAVGDWQIEIPAGRLEPGEDPHTTAVRELEEETGHAAGHLDHVRSFVLAPGFCNETMHLFHARDVHPIPGGGREPDEDEELELLSLSPAELLRGATSDAKTLLAAALLLGGDSRGESSGETSTRSS